MSAHGNKYLRRIGNLGFLNFLRYLVHKKTGLPRSGEFRLGSKFAAEPLVCRGGTSDIDVFKHIYVLREYAEIGGLPQKGLIIDCGANVGFSAAYFLNRSPGVDVIAVEPDPGNFLMLERNTEIYRGRCKRVKAGIWSESCGLRLVDAPDGDGREWARGVEVVPEGEPADIPAVSIASLLEDSRHDRIALLKIDIEGAEQQVFSHGDLGWLAQVDRIAIELHGEVCREAYLSAVDAAGFTSVDSGGLMLSTRGAG